jgi:hypothetical protein
MRRDDFSHAFEEKEIIMKRTIAILLAVMMLAALCGCSQTASDPRAAQAGVYTFYALGIGDYYIAADVMKGTTVTLNADGTGALDWGEDNKGPISEWTLDGDKVVLKAGISTMDATLKDGILTVDIGDDGENWYGVFVTEKADTSGYTLLSEDEMQKLYSGQ